MNNYVKCSRCDGWDDLYKRDHVCAGCNNVGTTIDPKEILCNLCGGPQRPLGTHNEQYAHGLEAAKVTGGYESYHLFDMTTYSFSFCEKCLRELFVQCKIKPVLTELIFGGAESLEDDWDRDQTAYEYRLWKDSGGHHQAYLDKTCNAIKNCPNKAIYTVRISEDFTEEACCEEHRARWNNTVNASFTKFIPNVLKPFL